MKRIIKSDNFVDFHTHILPEVDHGSDSLETTAFQLEMAKSFGISRILATSHFYPHQHTVTSFLNKRNTAYEKIKELEGNYPDIKLGAEVLLCEGLHKLENLEHLCLFGTKILLLELPFTSLTHGMKHAVRRLVENGFEVILAHADRYPAARIESLLEYGVKLQLNADSLTTLFKRKCLFDWLKRGLVVGIGTDIHGRDKKCYKKLLKALSLIEPYFHSVNSASDEIWKKALHF